MKEKYFYIKTAKARKLLSQINDMNAIVVVGKEARLLGRLARATCAGCQN